MLSLIKKLFKPVDAHCDIPCGIYETDTLKTAAQTCLKLTSLALEATAQQPQTPAKSNQLTRTVYQKEIQADLAKQQIYILWSDYFKEIDYQANDRLHQLLWRAAGQCSLVKQNLDIDQAKKLLKLVDSIDQAFKNKK